MGPYSHKGGQDAIAQAYSGVMWRRESDDQKPSIYPTTLCDYITGMHLMQGILLALRTRETAGVGQKVEVTMYDSMLHLQMQEACMQLNRGYEVNWGAMPLSGVFETTDGAVCMVGGFTPDPLARISEALGLDEDLTQRPEFATLEQQFEHKPALQAIFRERIATNTTEYWTTRLEDQGLLSAPVHTLEQALADAQTAGQRHDRGGRAPRRRHGAHAQRARSGSPPPRPPSAASRRGSASTTWRSCWRTASTPRPSSACSSWGCSGDRPWSDTRVDEVTLTIENHVATVAIDRQHVLNAVDGTAQARLNEIWDQIEADPDVRAVVITGAGDPGVLRRARTCPPRRWTRPAWSTGPAWTRTGSAG